MTEETKPTPRVIRRGNEPQGEVQAIRELETDSELFTATLSNGKVVTLREMTAADLLYLEKTLGNLGDMERSLKLAVRLSVEGGRVSYEDIKALKMKDLRKVTDLLAKAGDTGDDDEDDFPNE